MLPDAGQPPATCDGTKLVFGCNLDQAIYYDCNELGNGGVCTNATCNDLPAGAPCDTQGNFNCAAGHTCTNLPDGGGHVCI